MCFAFVFFWLACLQLFLSDESYHFLEVFLQSFQSFFVGFGDIGFFRRSVILLGLLV